MADAGPPPAGAQLPPPPQPNTGAPGYENGQNGQGNPAHMPPPPLHIPQNTNPIPTAITSPLTGGDQSGGIMSPSSGGGFVRRAAPEPNKRALYVGGLDPRVTEDVLRQIFETTGHVQNVKIIPDKNAKGYNYGFVEYDDPGAAERAMQTLNGRRVHQSEIRVNWAYQSNTTNKEDTSNHFHIFVGDLSNEVNDEVLLQAFSAFGSVSEARVMWDMKTGRSRGYGFVAFRDRPDAEKALSSMDGEWLGSRAIRCNWANQKGQPSIAQQSAMQQMGMTPTTPYGHHHFPTHGVHSYDMIVSQTPAWQTTCYVGNLTPYTTQNDLVPLFQNFGFVVESRFQADRGFAFIKMDSHENAAMAICQLNGYNVNGRPLKCSWGKDKTPNPTQQFDPAQAGYSPQNPQAPGGYPGTPSTYFPQYGAQYGGQQGNYAGPSAQSPAGYGGSPMGYAAGPPSAGGYGRGQQPPAQQWAQPPPGQNFNNGFQGYQG
ncbi:putative nuclear and cytoplasmic polyadenylated rna-binding protein pub1 protein [Phaeoacremonium minimum UCRPA7]|uniref:Putative nuclear and cytoplasmic polyadenylated rna-binding protein pub1 protein n=1 Tax=Phaeoacremonium minimum (strain UCR-PA7) TaxID=1286976 RepID=R8BYI0_PHAM7|nr:putative nuclear and cytoplasmic polyadenylated rna-binding protein pub1 protein [Phaeoacremonium minimum UCRPA7]EOO04418.1 putative nuclear and cytoplasmic polyadenylated rna-binding protein pub1 protein [Phaeoacremonium minimum UCRPA7]